MQEGKYAEACPKFADSNRLAPGAGTLLNLGACYEKNGQTASAWATYADAASQADHAGRKDWATKAKARMDALAPTLSKLSIVVPATAQAPGLVVKRDGVAVGASEYGVPIPVDPGKHTIEASADQKKPWTTTVDVDAKHASASVTVPALETADAPVVAAVPTTTDKPTTAPTNEPEKPAGDSKRGDTQRYIGLGLGGAGIVGIGVGVVFGLVATSKKSSAEDNCNADLSVCKQAGVDAMSSARGAATVSTIGFIAGGALLVGGVALYLTAPKNAPVSTVGLRVSPTPGGGNLSLGGAW